MRMGNGMLSQEEIDALLSGSMDIDSHEADEPVSRSSQHIELTDM